MRGLARIAISSRIRGWSEGNKSCLGRYTPSPLADHYCEPRRFGIRGRELVNTGRARARAAAVVTASAEWKESSGGRRGRNVESLHTNALIFRARTPSPPHPLPESPAMKDRRRRVRVRLNVTCYRATCHANYPCQLREWQQEGGGREARDTRPNGTRDPKFS